MGFVESNLMPGESITYQTKLTSMVYKIPLGFTALFFLLVLFAASSPDGVGSLSFMMVISLIWSGAAFLRYKTSEFAVTNKRVLIKVGIIKINSLETLLSKIEGIHVSQGIFGRMWNYGSITITGTGGTRNPFTQIDSPFEFRKKVQEQIESRDRAPAPLQPTARNTASTQPTCRSCGNTELQYVLQPGGKSELWCPNCKAHNLTR